MSVALRPAAPLLRPMLETDLERVTQVEQRAYPYPWTYGIFRDCLRAGYQCWALESNGELIGYGILGIAAGEAHVLNVCVAPEHQRSGHGRRLMHRLIDLARWHRCQRIYLEVRPSNPGAITLYDDLGFNEIGRRPNYYPAGKKREDAIVMAMELLPPED